MIFIFRIIGIKFFLNLKIVKNLFRNILTYFRAEYLLIQQSTLYVKSFYS